MNMYTKVDLRNAQRQLSRNAWILAAALTVLLAAYAAAAVLGSQVLMLVIAQLAFFFAAVEIALWLRPAMQYKAFLNEMYTGLRRECVCVYEKMDAELQKQDGVRVHAVHVRLDDGDTRIFYVNCGKTDCLPPLQSRIRLISYGRHLVEWEEIAP